MKANLAVLNFLANEFTWGGVCGGGGRVTAATAAFRGRKLQGSRLWVSSPIPQMALSD